MTVAKFRALFSLALRSFLASSTGWQGQACQRSKGKAVPVLERSGVILPLPMRGRRSTTGAVPGESALKLVVILGKDS